MGIIQGEYNPTYDMFSGDELKIAELIQQRRLQLLVHSCIYYRLNTNKVSDREWDAWAKELVKLQHDYPDIAKDVPLAEEFADWDGTTGEFLPIDRPNVVKMAKWLAGYSAPKTVSKPATQKSNKNKTKARLF